MPIRFLTIFLTVIALFLPIFLLAQAQNVELLVTWRTDSFVESGYRGKVLPAAGSEMIAALQLIDNEKPINLAPYRVSWFLDNRLLERGDGLVSVKFNTSPILAGGTHRLKIVVLDYKGADLQRIINIPVAKSEAIIKAPYPQGKIAAGTNNFTALFYNWNVKNPDDLLINWSVGDEIQPDATGQAVEIKIPESLRGQSVNIGVTAQNPGNDYERASAEVNLLIK